jgi:hypothetical protein
MGKESWNALIAMHDPLRSLHVEGLYSFVPSGGSPGSSTCIRRAQVIHACHAVRVEYEGMIRYGRE